MTLGILYPFAWYIWAYCVFGLWMWMFDGKIHTANGELTLQPVRELRPCTLRWAVYRGSNK